VSELQKRPGVTIMEVLAASAILVIAMAAISSTVSMALRKSKTPGEVEAAALMAAERLHYFRSQADPYRAAGGTHYTDPDANRDSANHNRFGRHTEPNAFRPRLFVREYLYAPSTNAQVSLTTGVDQRTQTQRRRNLTGVGGTWAYNQVPVTPAGVSRVRPNPDGNVIVPVPTAMGTASLPGGTEVLAPRANALISPTGTPANRNIRNVDIKFVREVWIQTCLPDSLGFANEAMGGGGAWFFPADRARNLPNYTVALTVRVFARDPKTWTLVPEAALPPGLSVPRNGTDGPGYDPRKPLASMVGYFGLRRMF
jgi:type II secretory pathway pseudopilin PulG